MRAFAVTVIAALAACNAQDDACVPDLSWGGSSNGPLYGAAMIVPMQISFDVKMDRTSGVLDVERWDGTAWQPQAPSTGATLCSTASPEWTDDLSFRWFPSSFDTCTPADQHWPEGVYFRWIARDFRSAPEAGGCAMDSAKYSLVYFDTCRFDSQEHCTGTPPPDYK